MRRENGEITLVSVADGCSLRLDNFAGKSQRCRLVSHRSHLFAPLLSCRHRLRLHHDPIVGRYVGVCVWQTLWALHTSSALSTFCFSQIAIRLPRRSGGRRGRSLPFLGHTHRQVSRALRWCFLEPRPLYSGRHSSRSVQLWLVWLVVGYPRTSSHRSGRLGQAWDPERSMGRSFTSRLSRCTSRHRRQVSSGDALARPRSGSRPGRSCRRGSRARRSR